MRARQRRSTSASARTRDAAPDARSSASTRQRPSLRTAADAWSTPTAAACACRPARRCRRSRGAVLRRRGWRWRERVALLRVADALASRAASAAPPAQTVADAHGGAAGRGAARPHRAAVRRRAQHARRPRRAAGLPARPARRARSTAPGAADLLLPRRRPRRRLPGAGARAGSSEAGATIRLGASRRAARARRRPAGASTACRVDRVVVAASAVEAARLARRTRAAGPTLRRGAAPRADRHRLPAQRRLRACPSRCSRCHADDGRPAQFVFDRGRLGGDAGLLALRHQRRAALGRARRRRDRAGDAGAGARGSSARHLRGPLEIVRTVDEKRATFACTPRLARPPMAVAPGLLACGDYIDGPYPATLEGAVRSGVAAARAATRRSGENSAMKKNEDRSITIQVLERTFALLDVLASHQEPVVAEGDQRADRAAPVDRAPHPQRPDDRPLRRPARGRQLPARHAPARTRQPGQGAARRARRRARADARAAQADAPAGQPVDAPGRRDRLHRAHLQRALRACRSCAPSAGARRCT